MALSDVLVVGGMAPHSIPCVALSESGVLGLTTWIVDLQAVTPSGLPNRRAFRLLVRADSPHRALVDGLQEWRGNVRATGWDVVRVEISPDAG